MPNNTNRRKDHRRNEVMNDYLDAFLYSSIEFSNVLREVHRDRQISGVDIEFDYNGKHYVCDEKAATDYVNKERPLNTFCLELSSMQGSRDNKVEREGWLTNDNEVNDSFLFVWVDEAVDSDISICNKEGIRKCEVCLVRKERIIEYLNSLGWDKESLRLKNYRIRHCNDTNFGNIAKNGCKFSFSKFNKSEEPINILLTRDIYRKISDYNNIITDC